MSKKQAIAVIIIVFLAFVFVGAVSAQQVGTKVTIKQKVETATTKPKVVKPKPKPRALAYPVDSFWDELARCETASDWQNGGNYAGGLGIYTKSTFPQSGMGTWERWGGEQFAEHPAQATREQQIIVANRIAIEGWTTTVTRTPEHAAKYGVPITYVWHRSPVGFNGWGALHCAGGTPPLFFYEEDDLVWVAKQRYVMGQSDKKVHDLQGVLGVKQDGVYGEVTRREHLKFLNTYGLSTKGVPA